MPGSSSQLHKFTASAVEQWLNVIFLKMPQEITEKKNQYKTCKTCNTAGKLVPDNLNVKTSQCDLDSKFHKQKDEMLHREINLLTTTD